MTSQLRLIGVAMVAVSLSLAGRAQNPVLAPPTGQNTTAVKDIGKGTASVVGRVVEAGSENGIAAAEVTVMVTGVSSAARRVLTTSENGDFLIEGIPGGAYAITVAKQEWMPGAVGRLRPNGPSRPIILAADERRTGVVMPMWRPAVISGVVRDERNEPLAGTRVQIFTRAFYAGVPRLVRTGGAAALTDSHGLYRVSGLAPGDYVVAINIPPRGGLIAQSDGFAYQPSFFPATMVPEQALVMTLASGEERPGVDFEARSSPAFSVSGVAVIDDLVAADTTVALIPVIGGAIELTPELQTGPVDSGAFRFERVAAGDYVLRVVAGLADKTATPHVANGTAWAEARISVVDRPVADLKIALQRGFRVTGSVQFTGTSPVPVIDPIPGLHVSLTPADGVSDRFTFVSVDARGRFATDGIIPGRYVFEMAGTANLGGWSLASAMYRGVDITDEPLELNDDVSEIVVTFTDHPTRVSGRVTAASGAPNRDATVMLFPTDDHAWTLRGRFPRRLRNVRASTDGSYALVNLPPGPYFLVALNSDELRDDWSDPAYLRKLSAVATRIDVRASERIVENLVTKRVR